MSYSEPPPPPQYGAPVPPQGGGVPPKTSSKAITSLVTGIASLPAVCCWPLSVILAIVALVFGFLGRRDIQGSGGQLKGAGMALAGIVTAAVALALIVVVLVLAATGVIDTNYEFSTD